jgi:hypothetical protein
MHERSVQAVVPEELSRLAIFESDGVDAEAVVDVLRQDRVALLRNVAPPRADLILHEVTEKLELFQSLQLQAAYAGFLGHRSRVDQYRMTVNKRLDHQFIPPHSEGDSFTNLQLAAFYCVENSTDGGETILLNVDGSSTAWNLLRERVTRIAPGSRQLTPSELKQATIRYRLRPHPYLLEDDQVIQQRQSEIPGLVLVDVLAKSIKTRSAILQRDLYAYWVSTAIADRDSLPWYVSVLEQGDFLRQPDGGLDIGQMDNAARQRVWSSGVDYNTLFRCKVTHKLTSGDLLLQNNLTWTHSAANWTPQSGVRNVSAAFA